MNLADVSQWPLKADFDNDRPIAAFGGIVLQNSLSLQMGVAVDFLIPCAGSR